MKRFIALAALALAATPAAAQEFNGSCTAFAAQDACSTSGWCQWVERKQLTLPDGSQFKPKGYCRFKSGFKAAWVERQVSNNASGQ